MRHRALTIVLIALLAIGLGAVASACDGDDGGGELTLEEFLLEIETLDNEFEARSLELEPQFEALTDDSSVEDVTSLLRDQAALIDEFVDGIADLSPPTEGEAIQEEAVAAGRAVVDAFEGLIDDADSAASLDELFAIFDEDADFTAADDRFTQVCLDAEQFAADNDITVDYNCDDGE